MIVEKFQPDGFGEIVIGTYSFSYFMYKLKLDISIDKIIWLIVVIIFATVYFIENLYYNNF